MAWGHMFLHRVCMGTQTPVYSAVNIVDPLPCAEPWPRESTLCTGSPCGGAAGRRLWEEDQYMGVLRWGCARERCSPVQRDGEIHLGGSGKAPAMAVGSRHWARVGLQQERTWWRCRRRFSAAEADWPGRESKGVQGAQGPTSRWLSDNHMVALDL